MGDLWSKSPNAIYGRRVHKPLIPPQSAEIVRSSAGVDIALHRFGGDGETLVLCHATGFNAFAYGPLMPTLTAEFDVVGFDFRGHGASSAPNDGDYGWDRMVDDLLAVTDHLGGGPVRAFGHSMGATTIVSAELRQPGTIAAAWLFEPIIFPDDLVRGQSTMPDRARKRRAIFDSREQALARYASRPPLGTWRADALAGYVTGGFRDLDDGTVQLACHPETEATIFESPATYANEITGFEPAAVVASGTSGLEPGPGDWAESITAALPNARHAHYGDLTHFGPFEAPTRLASDAASFLSDSQPPHD